MSGVPGVPHASCGHQPARAGKGCNYDGPEINCPC